LPPFSAKADLSLMSAEKNDSKIQAALAANPAAAAAKRKVGGLGRGLNALIEGNFDKPSERLMNNPNPVNVVGLIPVGHIETNPYQPRTHFDQDALQELAESIRTQGIIQPVTVRQTGTNAYQLISGERRLQASKIAGLDSIPAYIRKANDQQMLEMALIENIQRENLNAIEIALSYQRLLSECSLRQEDLGERVGKNRSTVTNYLRLLKLPPDIQIGLRDSIIGMGHARALITIEDPQQQLALFRRIVAEDLSVRRVEELVRQGFGRPTPGSPQEQREQATSIVPVAELRRTERLLTDHFGSKVQLRPGAQGRGEIKISFDSVEDMQRILHILQPA
jgi:ParB family chromosome partitioning protein